MPDALLKKLQFKQQSPVLALNVPEIFEPVLDAIGANVDRERGDADCYGAVFVFVASVREAQTWLGPAADAVCADGLFWAAYPKKSSKRYGSDMSRDHAEAWAPLAERGFEPVRQVSIDDDWSALRFKRVEDIPRLTRSFARSEAGKKRTGQGE